MIGVGAAFDFLSGRKVQAPRWIQASGFEWLFRMATEPRRLAGRYLRTVPAFLFLAALAALGLRRVPLQDRTRPPVTGRV
jgi:N-acetylglucosaminyldiphosphoundecaprenol N-acetyl-beta-D-mannosaminyltransferase